MSKKTVLHDEHLKLGGRMVDFAGWIMPVQYSGVTDEHIATRKSAGLFDVSHMGTFEISGKNASLFLDYLTPTDASGLSNGQASYSLLMNERATIIDDIIIYKFQPEKFYMVVNASNVEKDFEWIKQNLGSHKNVELKDLSDKIALIAIQGPKAAATLSKITDASLSEIQVFHLCEINIKGSGKVLIARTGYTGEDGFEIFAPAEKAVQTWNSLLEAGREDGLKPAGLGARDTLRLEMKYCLYGHEIDDTTNPLEAGLKWVIKFKKESDFIGKAALLKAKDEGIKRKLVGFKMLDKAVPRHGYTIMKDGNKIGDVTSGTFSPSLQIPIGIGYVKTEFADIGTKIYVDIRGKERLAEVVKTPFYTKT